MKTLQDYFRSGWFVLSLILFPGLANGQPSSLNNDALHAKKAELDAKEAEILAAIDKNEKDKIAHNQKAKTLDRTNDDAVADFNREAREGRENHKRLENELDAVRRQKAELRSPK